MAHATEGYLHHGAGTQGPFCTEKVQVKTEDNGNTWKCRFEKRWRSVRFQGNDTFIIFQGERIQIQIEGVGKW